ncbi:D-isomer-specific 2-hydroxyacid dehydrogenase family protein [Macrophomina phaseolina]|uniref:D-isomer-specific 2-hydroxyacid dehydrogenase family protein n=1 Tax=Macrophomina phaseolina TaxID=35725 RepID=A0ABQ8GRG8_9PEZI|nr:D-isomer-specific 2-hydroxyacid dehydrogenase family protein [Macrophomina phaseolina]
MSSPTHPSSLPKPIKLAILDDYQRLSGPYFSHFSPSDLEVTTYTDTISPHTDLPALIARLQPYTIVCTMRERTPFPAALTNALPNLRLLLTTGSRNNALDLPALAARGIPVAGTPSDVSAALAPPTGFSKTTQHAWALTLALSNNIARDDASLRAPPAAAAAWQAHLPLNVYLAGKTFAVLGLGKLGVAAAKIAVLGFGMRVVAWSANLTQHEADRRAREAGLESGSFEVVGSKAELLKRADVLSLHYVLSERSRGIVGTEELALLKKDALLVNTARGPLVDEDALFEALDKGQIRGAALDVFWEEPLPAGSRWRTTRWGEEGRSQVLMTPHTGYMFEETMDLWWKETASNVKRWLNGEELTNKMI